MDWFLIVPAVFGVYFLVSMALFWRKGDKERARTNAMMVILVLVWYLLRLVILPAVINQ